MLGFIVEMIQFYTGVFMYVTDSGTWQQIATLEGQAYEIYLIKAIMATAILFLIPIAVIGCTCMACLASYAATNHIFGKRIKESLEVVATDFIPAGPAISEESGRTYHRNASWLVSVKSPCGIIHSMHTSEGLFKTAKETGELTMSVLRGAFSKKMLCCTA
ncbi:MAG: hypothetical protein OSB62_01095 [Alphaproteobacteria bacterium]|nr:hypothetical protein [Alphaproteobacteria bacterium]